MFLKLVLCTLVFTSVSHGAVFKDKADHELIERAAIGRMASLGDLYDARTDRFSGLSIFKTNVPKKAFTYIDAPFSDIHLMHSDSYSDKFNQMSVNAELSVSVLGGLFKMTGSGSFFQDEKSSSHVVKSSLIYKVGTADENLNIFHDDVKGVYSLDAIQQEVATHVVTGISWGSNSILSFTHEQTNSESVQEISGALSAKLKMLAFSISGSASVNFTEGGNSSQYNFDMRIFGDILPEKEKLPTTDEGALELMSLVPSLINGYNDGKGKPLMYRLIPITMLQEYLAFNLTGDTILRNLDQAALNQVVQVFDRSTAAKQDFNAFAENVDLYKKFVTNEERVMVMEYKTMIASEESMMRGNLAILLQEARAGIKTSADIELFIQEVLESRMSPERIMTQLDQWKYLDRRINLVQTLLTAGANYLDIDDLLDDQDFSGKVYVLYLRDEAMTENDTTIWKENKWIFLEEIKEGLGMDRTFYVVNCDILICNIPDDVTSVIKVYDQGVILIEDYLHEVGRRNGNPRYSDNWVRTEVTNDEYIPDGSLNADYSETNYTYICRFEVNDTAIGEAFAVGYVDNTMCRGVVANCPLATCELHSSEHFSILVLSEDSVVWGPSRLPMAMAVSGGANREIRFYLCRTKVGEATIVGAVKFYGTNRFCYVYDSNSVKGAYKDNFEMLVHVDLEETKNAKHFLSDRA